MSQIREQIAPDTETRLASQAQERGIEVNTYLQVLLGAPQQSHALATLSDQEFEALMKDLAEGTASRSLLPADFSPVDIYADHD